MDDQLCAHPTCVTAVATDHWADPFGDRWCVVHARWCQLLNAASLTDWPAVVLAGRLTAGPEPWRWRVLELSAEQVDAAIEAVWDSVRDEPLRPLRLAEVAPVQPSRLGAFAARRQPAAVDDLYAPVNDCRLQPAVPREASA